MTLHVLRRGTGPAVLLLHGAYLSHAQWLPNIDSLVAAGYAVIAPDLPGHGESPRLTTPITVKEMADAVADATTADGPLFCAGIGLGGMVAQALAHKSAQRVRGQVLADPSHGLRSTPIERMETDFTNAVLKLSTVEWQAGLFARALARQSPGARAFVQQHLDAHAQNPENYRAIWHAYTAFDSLPSLPHMAQPALLLVADANARDARHARVMQQRMPNARLEVIANASHMMNMDNPQAFNSAVLQFLRGLNPQTS